MKYYIIPQSEVEKLLPKSKQSFGHENVKPGYSLDGTKAIMQFTDELAPKDMHGYTTEEIKAILRKSEWTEESELPAKNRIALMMEKGNDLVKQFQAENSDLIDAGKITEQETLEILDDVDVSKVINALLSGTLKGALYIIGTRFVDGNGESTKSWMTTERIHAYIADIQGFLSEL